MANATSRLQIQIEAKNAASPAIKGITGDLQGMDKAAGSLAGGLGGLAGAAGVAGIAALGTAAVGAAMDMSRMAATATDVAASFESMAGAGAEDMFEGLKEASRGAISDMDLMLSANRAMLLGVADSTEEMVALMDVARARSQAMGTTTAEAFSDLVVGLGRGSTAILDNLGIMLDADTVNQEYAESIGKTVGKLTDQEKKQALVNAVLRESEELVRANEAAGDDAASNFERMDAAITNAKVALGERSSAMIAFANALAEATTDMVDAMHNANEQELELDKSGTLQAMIANIREVNQSFAEEALASRMAQEGVVDVGRATQAANAYIEEFTSSNLNLVPALAAVDEAAYAVGRSFSGAGPYVDYFTQKLAQLAAQSGATVFALAGIASAAVGALHSAASAAVGIMNAGDIAGIYTENKKALEGQIKAMEAVGMTTEEIDFRTQEYAKKASLPFDLAVEAAREAEKANRAAAKSVDALSAEYTNLQSKVQGVLQGALDPGVGVDPYDVLESMGFPREDAINENARRLADIAKNGLKGQEWLDEFQSEVPDIWKMIRLAQNPQEEAARLLRDFQDGLLTSPIDKEKAKEIVKRQILGDQNMAALANEIAQELAAEMGIPMQQALAATQGTLGTGGGAGTQAATTLSDAAAAGLEDTNGGGMFVDKFIEQMRSRYSLLQTAGTDAGKQWGNSFLAVVGENVPTALIEMLATLVTPAVFAKFAQQGTLQGAAP